MNLFVSLPGKLKHIKQLVSQLFSALFQTKTQNTRTSKTTIIYLLYAHTLIRLRCENTLTASMMTECGVLAVNTKPRLLAPLTNAPSSKHNMNI